MLKGMQGNVKILNYESWAWGVTYGIREELLPVRYDSEMNQAKVGEDPNFKSYS